MSVPTIGAVRVEAANNTGFGFWTNQNQGALYIYPSADRRMAFQNSLTWEANRKKRGFDLTPGQNLPTTGGEPVPSVKKGSVSARAEIGPAGYNSFQISNDTGTDARNPEVHDRVHGVGVQVGVTAPKRGVVLNFLWLHEYSAVDRFQGSSMSFNLSFKL